MKEQYCCDEMRELVKSMIKGQTGLTEVKLFFDDNKIPEEMAFGRLDSKEEWLYPNLIFRFCPYCGAVLQKSEVKKDDTFVGKLASVVFDTDLDQEIPPQNKAALLQDAISKVRTIVRGASVSSKPTGMFKTG